MPIIVHSVETEPAKIPSPFIGGPKDGTWEKVDPREEFLYNGYERRFLKWGKNNVRYYAVFIYKNFPEDDILQTLLMGYGNNAGHAFKIFGTKIKPTGRKFNLE